MQPSAEKIWITAQGLLKTMLNADLYNLWFMPVRAVALEKDTLTLEVADEFCEVWLKDNYIGLIRDVLMHASGTTIEVKFQVSTGTATLQNTALLNQKAKAKAEADDNITAERNQS